MNTLDGKGYGIVIPADWEPRRFKDMTADEILRVMLRLDEDAFYRMAEAVDIDLDLLTRAGYEYEGLSSIALEELTNFLHDEPLVGKLSGFFKAIGNFDDFEFVHALYTHNPDWEPNIFAQELVRMFVEEFPDNYTDARREVLEKYGDRFQSCPAYNDFVTERFFFSWFCKPGPNMFEEKIRPLKELMSVYSLLKDGGEFLIQSTKVRNRKAILSKEATDMLADMILMAAPHLHNFDFRLGEVEGTFNRDGEYIPAMSADNETFRKIVAELDDSIDQLDSGDNVKLFYYAADDILNKYKGKNTTQYYVFLYRLAIFFKYITPSAYEDLSNAQDRKTIAASVKSQINTIKASDKDKSILSKLMSR